eukprot:815366-Prymnesium_polylepis.1
MRGQSRLIAVVFMVRRAKVSLATIIFDDSVSAGSLTLDRKFGRSAAVGNVVVFAPFDADVVGVYNVTSGTFDVSISAGGLALNQKFSGAVA